MQIIKPGKVKIIRDDFINRFVNSAHVKFKLAESHSNMSGCRPLISVMCPVSFLVVLTKNISCKNDAVKMALNNFSNQVSSTSMGRTRRCLPLRGFSLKFAPTLNVDRRQAIRTTSIMLKRRRTVPIAVFYQVLYHQSLIKFNRNESI